MTIYRVIQKALLILVKFVSALFGRNGSIRIRSGLSEKLIPVSVQKTQRGDIRFYCLGLTCEWRARTLLTKEPDTIRWIDSFKAGEVFWDIGANVGVFSLYASRSGLSVLAFEPSPANYYLLNKNIEINSLDSSISAYCIAFSRNTLVGHLNMSTTEVGGAFNSFEVMVDWKGDSFMPAFRQAMIGYSIDDFIRIFCPPFPNHIKIDVDGLEGTIIAGATKTLSDPRLQSVLLELDCERNTYCQDVISMMESAGLKINKNTIYNDQLIAKRMKNIIFTRI